MSDNHYNNNFLIHGDGNNVTIHQRIGNDSNEALALVLKFLITILLSPIFIPLLLTLNGVRLLQESQQEGDDA